MPSKLRPRLLVPSDRLNASDSVDPMPRWARRIIDMGEQVTTDRSIATKYHLEDLRRLIKIPKRPE